MTATAQQRTAVYPGSFDPLTTGHVDIARRAVTLCDRLIVAVLINSGKAAFLDVAERVRIAQDTFADEPRIEVLSFDGLLVDLLDQRSAAMIIRGVRDTADMGFELPLAQMNRHLRTGTETVFLAASPALTFVSSRLVREIVSHGGPWTTLVPPAAHAVLHRRSGARG